MRLPVVLAAELQTSVATEIAKPIGRPLRVLVVDDNVDTAQTLACYWKSQGMTFAWVTTV